MTNNGQNKQLKGFVNIDIDNIARWIFKEGINDIVKWEDWIANAQPQKGNPM